VFFLINKLLNYIVKKFRYYFIYKLNYFFRYKKERKRLIKKFLRLFILEFVFIIISLIFLPFFLILKKYLNIRIHEIVTSRIGHLMLNSELYLCKLQFKKEKNNKIKTLDIFYNTEKISNSYLFFLVKKKIFIYSRLFLSTFHKILIFFKIKNIEVIEIKESYDKNNLLDLYKPFLQIPKNDIIKGWKILEKKFNTPRDQFENKIIFFSLRDSVYLEDEFPDHEWNYHNYRDVDSNNYIYAAEALAEKGYKIFRIGKKVKKPFISNNPNIVDYANSNFRSDFLDIFLGKVSKFGLSTGTGIENIATIFRKPLCVIHVPFELSYFHCGNLIMTRHHYSEKLNRNLTISEIFEHGSTINFNYTTKNYKSLGIKLIESNEEDIKNFVLERLCSLKNSPKDYFKSELQEEFWKVFKFNLNKYNINYHKNINGFYSNFFLNKNRWFIK